MKFVALRAAVIGLLAVLSATDRAGAARQHPTRTGAAVMAYERARAAAVRLRDDRAYERLASPILTVVNSDGMLFGRNERLGDVRTGKILPRPGQVDEYLNIRVFGDLALVSGRSSWRHADNTLGQEYFLRVWERSSAGWRLIAAHYTGVPREALTTSSLVRPPSVLDPAEPVVVRAIDPGRGSANDVLYALHEQHRLYWEKNIRVYSQYVGNDLLRIAEHGVRTKAELVSTMQDKLLRPKTPQVDERVHVVGNAATVTWRDAGVSDDGRPTQAWFTMIFVKREGQWQIVQMHSTPILPDRALPVRQ